MKLYLDAPAALSDAIAILAEDLGLTLVSREEAEGTVTVNEVHSRLGRAGAVKDRGIPDHRPQCTRHLGGDLQ